MARAEREMQNLGVLSDEKLFIWEHATGTYHKFPMEETDRINLEILHAIAIEHAICNLWIVPGAAISRRFYDKPASFAADIAPERYRFSVKYATGHGGPCSATCIDKLAPTGCRPMIRIFLPDQDPTWLEDVDDAESWALADVENPMHLLGTLVAIYQRTGVHLNSSPAKTCTEMWRLETNLADWRRSPEERDLPHFSQPDLQFLHFLPDWTCGLHLHRYDHRGHYDAACTGAELGIGMAEYCQGSAAAMPLFIGGVTGLWDVSVSIPADLKGWPRVPAYAGRKWMETNGVKALLTMGYEIDINNGWIWQNSKERIGRRRVLANWARKMWGDRQALREKYGPDNPAFRLTKMMYKTGLGWLDLQVVAERIRAGCDEKEIAWYHKPHWYAGIKGLATFRVILKIKEIAEKRGLFPIMGYTDELGYLTDEPDPIKAFPELLYRRDKSGELRLNKDELGGWEHKKSHLVTPEFIRLFNTAETPNELLRRLKGVPDDASVGR